MARPRSQAAHRAALDATVEVMVESGVEGVTLEEVAARSGVARSTLYRHFGSKEALVVQAAKGCLVEQPTPDTGSLETDLEALFAQYRADESHEVPDLIPMLLDAATRDPELHRVFSELLDERRRPLRTVLRLAQLRGEIAPDLDLDDALALIIGPFTFRRMVDRQELTPEFTETVLRVTVAGLRAAMPATAR